MKRAVWIAVLAAAMLSFGLTVPATAGMNSVTLGVRMYCPFCAYNVRQSLRRVPGVNDVIVSLRTQSALVIYDDSVAEVSALVAAPERIGYETTVLGAAEASLRDPRGAPTKSPLEGNEEDDFWAYLRSLLSGPEPRAR